MHKKETTECFPNSQIDMVEINPRAMELAILNAKKNNCDVNIFESDVYSNVNDIDYTDIVTNPPIRAGKKVIYHAHSTEEDFKNSFILCNAQSNSEVIDISIVDDGISIPGSFEKSDSSCSMVAELSLHKKLRST